MGTGARSPRTFVVILDGTMSSLAPGEETNAGLLFGLLGEGARPDLEVWYEPGIQWRGWKKALEVIAGIGLNRQIRRAYRFLAQGWRPGDRIFLFGYSRGAFAVRSLAGVIARNGLLRPEHASRRNTEHLYRYYRERRASRFAALFARRYCWPPGSVPIEMIGVWDTVEALGLRWPILWRLVPQASEFHSANIGPNVRVGVHALAHDERRVAFTPVPWTTTEADRARVEQVWFPGTHGDIGGQLGGVAAARGLSNLTLGWMLDRAEAEGLPLPKDWRARFPADPLAPSVGMNAGFGKLFLARRARAIGNDPSERVHPAVAARKRMKRGWTLALPRFRRPAS